MKKKTLWKLRAITASIYWDKRWGYTGKHSWWRTIIHDAWMSYANKIPDEMWR